MSAKHTFHIPVMGTGFTLDSPLKVAHYGINSVVSIVDDVLIESLRKNYCEKFELPYKEISNKIEDFRAKRITSYLNMLNELVEKKFNQIIDSSVDTGREIKAYFSMLPDSSEIKKQFEELTAQNKAWKEIKQWAGEHLTPGSIDVNIMTKLDKANYNKNGEVLTSEYNDAHAALRGFAQSELESSLVLSAGMNPRLYSYMEKFEDFYPDSKGNIKKKIVIKVSDYRSALIQGKFLAKKGLWVSEYRIESGLNCGGHAFATDGYLMGPILEEFKNNKQELLEAVHSILTSALTDRGTCIPSRPLPIKITAQGGVGTQEEHQFLLEHYEIDSVGWGSPFLLVPEATTVDNETLHKLAEAREKDLYLSNISPLGVPFNNLKGNSKDREKQKKITTGRPGSPCPKEFLALSREYTDRTICTASRQYQRNKIKELKQEDLSAELYKMKYQRIVDKTCLCMGLGAASEQVNQLDTQHPGKGVAICPGPNMAYFSKIMSLKEMTDHIYGRANLISHSLRPHMFLKELKLYLEYLQNKMEESKGEFNKKQEKYFLTFSENMRDGIAYYQDLFDSIKSKFKDSRDYMLKELQGCLTELETLENKIQQIVQAPQEAQ